MNITGAATGVLTTQSLPVSVYYDYSSKMLQITGDDITSGQLTIYSLTGKVILQEKNLMTNQQISMSLMNSGIYIVKIEKGGLVSSQKVVVK